jgi:hypothetical protein
MLSVIKVTSVKYVRKKFYNTGPNVIKLFTSIIKEQARVFVLGKSSHPNLMFVGKARSLLQSVEHLKSASLR